MSRFAGFTLIEVMVVMAIIGLAMGIAVTRLGDKKGAMRTAVRELASTVREIHNHARLHNSTYRLVIRMQEKGEHSFMVQSAPGNITLLSAEQEEELRKQLSSDQEKAKKERDVFTDDARILKQPRKLPKGLRFGEVEYGGRRATVSEGETYIHFFPQGLVEEAAIHITDGKTLNWTIALHPITGRANLYEGNIPLKELRDQ